MCKGIKEKISAAGREEISAGDFYWRDIEKLPKDWSQGAFHGNGELGSMVWFTEHDGGCFLHVELGSNLVYDRRKSRDFWMAKQFDNPRLPIGYLEYPLPKENTGLQFTMHTDIYEAATTVTWRTGQEEEDMVLKCSFYVCAKAPLIVICQEKGELDKWHFVPHEAVSPRQSYGLAEKEEMRIDREYVKNPAPKLSAQERSGKIREAVCVQKLAEDYRTVTVCRYAYEKNTILISVEQGQKLSAEDVRRKMNAAEASDYRAQHLEWWKSHYEISGLRVPDKRIGQFYWRQIYKSGSAVRRESPVLDNQGPWLTVTPWPGTWWNLNVQLCYWHLYTAGRLEQAESLNRHLQKYRDELTANVPEKYRDDSSGMGTNTTWNLKSKIADPLIDNGQQFVELGNLTWVLHDCWLYYRMTMDERFLKEFFYPLLRRSINYYLHFLEKGEDGAWHLPPTASPEYGQRCADCNYDLSLLLWGCETLLNAADRLGISDEKEKLWEDICRNLTDFPKDQSGYMIGRDLPYGKSHRHFSHLMMHVPLYLVNRDNSDSWELLEKSVRHWFSYEGDIMGFSYVGASLMYSAYQKGTKALDFIRELMDRHITENSMYREAGPVMETPLAAAECIQQLLLQSWGGRLRVFPAVPEEWKEAAFWNFAAQGGFRVSAVYEGGRTDRIEIKSLAGEPCIVESDMEIVKLCYPDGSTERRESTGVIEVPLGAGEEIVLIRADDSGEEKNSLEEGEHEEA